MIICGNCIHRLVCHSSRVIEGLLDKVKEEMVTLVEGHESQRYDFYGPKPGGKTLDRIASIDESLRTFERTVMEVCQHHEEKTSDA